MKNALSSPYVGLIPFDEGEQDFFFGREVEIGMIVANLFGRRVTLLHGATGVGKTSLLRAGLLPHMKLVAQEARENDLPDFTLLYFNQWSLKSHDDIVKSFQQELQRVLAENESARQRRKGMKDARESSWKIESEFENEEFPPQEEDALIKAEDTSSEEAEDLVEDDENAPPKQQDELPKDEAYDDETVSEKARVPSAQGPGVGASTGTLGLTENGLGLAACGATRVLVVLDQFEEYFRYHDTSMVEKGFVRRLMVDLQNASLQVNVIFSLRDDALAKMDSLKCWMPTIFDNMVRISHLNLDQAKDVIEKPLAKWTELYGGEEKRKWIAEEKLVHLLIEQTGLSVQALSGNRRSGAKDVAQTNYVEAAYLQLALERLWALHEHEWSDLPSPSYPRLFHSGPALKRHGEADVKEENLVRSIVDSYLENKLKNLIPRDRYILATLAPSLITADFQKLAFYVERRHEIPDLAHLLDADMNRIPDLMKELADPSVALLRKINVESDPQDQACKEPIYELYHDLLAGAFVGWRRAVLARRAEERRSKSKIDKLMKWGAVAGFAVVLILLCIIIYANRVSQSAATIVAQANYEASKRELLIAEQKAEELRKKLSEVNEKQTQSELHVRAELAADRDKLIAQLEPLQRNYIPKVSSGSKTGKTETIAQVVEKLRDPMVKRLAGFQGRLSKGGFSSDGTLIATGGVDGKIRLWDNEGNLLGESVIGAEGTFVTALTFVPETSTLVASASSNSLRVFNWDSESKKLQVSDGFFIGNQSVSYVDFTQDGRLCVSCSEDGTAVLIDWEKRQVLNSWVHTREPKPLPVTYGAFSIDGKRVATSSDDGNVRVFNTAPPFDLVDAKSGNEILNPYTFGHTPPTPMRGMRFSPIDSDLVVGGAGLSNVIWLRLKNPASVLRQNDKKTESVRGPYVHEGAVVDVAFRREGTHVASIAMDGLCLIWDTSSSKSVASLPTEITGRLFDVEWSGDLLALVGEDGWLEVWDMKNPVSPKPYFSAPAHKGFAWGVRFNSTGSQLITWSGFPKSPETDLPWAKGKALEKSLSAPLSDDTAVIWDLTAAGRKGWTKH